MKEVGSPKLLFENHDLTPRARIRASFVQYNTLEEAEGLLRALAEMRA